AVSTDLAHKARLSPASQAHRGATAESVVREATLPVSGRLPQAVVPPVGTTLCVNHPSLTVNVLRGRSQSRPPCAPTPLDSPARVGTQPCPSLPDGIGPGAVMSSFVSFHGRRAPSRPRRRLGT